MIKNIKQKCCKCILFFYYSKAVWLQPACIFDRWFSTFTCHRNTPLTKKICTVQCSVLNLGRHCFSEPIPGDHLSACSVPTNHQVGVITFQDKPLTISYGREQGFEHLKTTFKKTKIREIWTTDFFSVHSFKARRHFCQFRTWDHPPAVSSNDRTATIPQRPDLTHTHTYRSNVTSAEKQIRSTIDIASWLS